LGVYKGTKGIILHWCLHTAGGINFVTGGRPPIHSKSYDDESTPRYFRYDNEGRQRQTYEREAKDDRVIELLELLSKRLDKLGQKKLFPSPYQSSSVQTENTFDNF